MSRLFHTKGCNRSLILLFYFSDLNALCQICRNKSLRTTLSFKSTLFHPVPEELDEEHENYINPGIFAYELANFLEQGLSVNDYKITFRCSEDWGYWQEIEHDDKYTLAIGCSNIVQQENDFSEHRVFVKPDSPIIRPPRRLFKKTYVQ